MHQKSTKHDLIDSDLYEIRREHGIRLSGVETKNWYSKSSL